MEGGVLTREEAFLRSGVISDVSYKILLVLTPGEQFLGTLVVSFELAERMDLWLDFNGLSVNSLVINDVCGNICFANNRISLGWLEPGMVNVRVTFKSCYSHDGLGLHSLIDPADKEVYLYTQFEPFAANRVFPCFDQPDLKACFELLVVAKGNWEVISNTALEKEPGLVIYKEKTGEIDGTKIEDIIYGSDFLCDNVAEVLGNVDHLAGFKVHQFKRTKLMSTYLVAVCAGPFYHESVQYKYPLGFYCRKSVQKLLDVERYKSWTIAGFEFYEKFFDFPYPFEKYDQVFVPEFNFVAMENVGCVTLDDTLLLPDGYTQNKALRSCIIVLHEMSHMWFGDLVTMRWWDDLWLNESFATFISVLCTSKTLSNIFPETWIWFYTKCRNGLLLDQKSTTHPIFCNIRHSIEIFSYFDAITYEKGSNVLKQLYFLIGEEKFKQSLSSYFKKHQFSNTSFKDLISEVKLTTSDWDMEDWAEKWIKTAGVNLIQAEVLKNSEGLIEKINFFQSATSEELDTCRLHSFKFAIFSENYEIVHEQAVIIENRSVLITLENPLHGFLLVDYGHNDYSKVIFDPESLKFFSKDLKNLSDPLTRTQIYGRLLDLTTGKKMEIIDFFDFAITNLKSEKELFNVIFLIRSLCEVFKLLEYHRSLTTIQHYSEIAFSILKERLEGADDKTRRTLLKMMLKVLNHPKNIIELVSWLDRKDLSSGFRWGILKRFSSISNDARALVEKEFENNSSHDSALNFAYCSAAYPDIQVKKLTWKKIVSEGINISKFERTEIMKGFNQVSQKDLLKPFGFKYFFHLLRVAEMSDLEFSTDFVKHLLPLHLDDCELRDLMNWVKIELPESRSDLAIIIENAVDSISHRLL